MTSAQIYNSRQRAICVAFHPQLFLFMNADRFKTTNSPSEFYFKVEFLSEKAQKEFLIGLNLTLVR